ncbi:hypothetical protein LTS17_003918 [Exophiala oligosperma]
MNNSDADRLRQRVLELETELQTTKALLSRIESKTAVNSFAIPVSIPVDSSIHNLMLLSDSALPLGSFAYSSGLESFLAHHKPLPKTQTNLTLFLKFLRLSIQSVAYTNVPYVLSAFRDPLGLADLDNDLDASTPCTVARRASIAQGRALLSVWEKAFSQAFKTRPNKDEGLEALLTIEIFARDLKLASISSDPLPLVNAHLAPLWGVVCLALGLNLEEAGYLFLLNHAKAVLSAAVRASVMGPYMAQNILAGRDLQSIIRQSLEKIWFLQPEDAGQVVPTMDLWIGRHEMLYSRIFNS